MGRLGGLEKENKFTLGTERCENIKNQYLNKIIIIIIIIIINRDRLIYQVVGMSDY